MPDRPAILRPALFIVIFVALVAMLVYCGGTHAGTWPMPDKHAE